VALDDVIGNLAEQTGQQLLFLKRDLLVLKRDLLVLERDLFVSKETY
jgi:hypothetical protein